jgi:ABC-type multidrug transport system ATPase subunit
LRTKPQREDSEDVSATAEPDLAAEITRVESSTSGLRAKHLTKSFGDVLAVDDITFGISPSTVFALLGPNGAGKSTIISLIRGDLRPDHRGGDVFVEGISVDANRTAARRHLGVCPQFDAMDSMTVEEHLRFYARARGVADVRRNVDTIITAVGLTPYRERMAQKLSGGSKRKLSLGIALMGNPAVLLLDEPSSGMDAASKRVMWRTLEAVTRGRGMLITTHSMEEADRLAHRAGIMATRMLALDTVGGLRKRFGDVWHVHIILKGAPHVDDVEGIKVKEWIEENVKGAVFEDARMWYGQLRFKVVNEGNKSSVAGLFRQLEENKEDLGLQYYSVSQTTLDQVFLMIVGRHNVEEEMSGPVKTKRSVWRWVKMVLGNA